MKVWKNPGSPVGPTQRDLQRRTSCMAQRKGMISARVGALLLAVLLLGILMAGRVLILNQMTGMRSNIAVLTDRKGFLEAQSASLQQKWNQETSAEVICARAEKELGLIRPEEPGLVLVCYDSASDNHKWAWPDWLENLARGNSAMAAEPAHIAVSESMISLTPVSSGQKNKAVKAR